MWNQANNFVGVTEPHDARLGDNLSFANFTAAEIEIDHQIARLFQVAETGGRRRHLETKARGVGILRMRKGGLACLEFYGIPEPGAGEIAWLLDPDLYTEDATGD